MEDPRISRIYLAMVKQWFDSLFHGVWRRNLLRSGMLTGLILTLAVIGLGTSYYEHMHGNFHKLKAKIVTERRDVVVPRPGGKEPIVLTRTRLAGGAEPEFLSVTVLPGRGMNVFQITAYIPGKGEVSLLASPSVEAAESSMTGKGADADGAASLAMGAAFQAPWAGGIWPTQPGGHITAIWRGHAINLPGNSGSVARGGLMLSQPAETADATALPDGGQTQALFHAGDFGGRWPSRTDVNVSILLSSKSIEMTVTARNAGDAAEPIGLGWRPRFAAAPESRGQMRLRIPGEMREEVRDPATRQPSGTLVPVAGTPYDFTSPNGVELGNASLDDSFVELHQELLDNGPMAELIDPADNYGLRLTALSSAIKAMHVLAPAGAGFVSIDPLFNYDDPFGHEWGKDVNTGMVVLQPGQSTQWKIRLELFTLSGSQAPS